DLADFPLTKEELFAFLWLPPWVDYDDFSMSLRGDPPGRGDEAIPPCSEKFGYFFLPNRQDIVESRRRRLLISEVKMKIAERAIKKIRAIPFLKAVFVCNSVGSYQAAEESDIDFFIVAAPGRIWLVRFFTNLILRLCGLRTYGEKIKNRICLSFFVDTKNLNLSPFRIADDDIHFAYWLHQMAPLYDPESLYEKFINVNNWTEKYLPNINSLPHADYLKKIQDSRLGNLWKEVWEKMWGGAYGDLLEKQARAWQVMKMKLSLKEKAEKGDNGVVLGDGVIKLHENDARSNFRVRWTTALHNFLI
ncbi:hypothetical protein KKC87_00285, partial [Patescibacteria group bacterium]|nr:hypothetical protein [Patescibacteria group bacterium]